MRISIVTVVYNNPQVHNAIETFKSQDYENKEYVVIDGGSTDNTLDVLSRYGEMIDISISEPDGGIYDALNKGLRLATGDVVGLLHSDDGYTDSAVLSDVAECFLRNRADVVYGDLQYVAYRKGRKKVIRHWVSGEFNPRRLKFGWMPPHPAVFIKKSVVEKIGEYDTTYTISGDYDYLVRLLQYPGLRVSYLPRTCIEMKVGGASNRSLGNIMRKTIEDLRVTRERGLCGMLTVLSKNLSKISQFLVHE